MPKNDTVVGGKLPKKSTPSSTAAFAPLISQHRTESATGETDLPFDSWLKQTNPTAYSKWLVATGQGK